MSVLACDDITRDFINELKDYIPSMRENSVRLMDGASDGQPTDLNEFHRLVHTIRGASTLVKIDNLAKVAAELEAVLEAIITNHLNVDAEVCKVIASAIDYFDTFAKAALNGDDVDEDRSATIILALSELGESAVQSKDRDLLSNYLSLSDHNRDDEFDSEDDSFVDGSVDTPLDCLFTDKNTSADLIADDDLDELEASCQTGTESTDDRSTGGHQADDEFQDPVDLSEQALLDDFLQEAEDHFQDLAKALGALEKQITSPAQITPQSKELIRLIRRSVHTVKGAAAVIQLDAIAAWGHEVEDVLDWLYEEADTITPENVEVLIDATYMLERYVTAPQKIDQKQLKLLRFAFNQMIDDERDDSSEIGLTPSSGVAESPDDSDIIPPSEDLRPLIDDSTATASDRDKPPPELGHVKTLRVEMTKIESMVNLASELTTALSAFDQDMEGLGNLIGEIDRARSRLKRTARDLEIGYEVKAIQQLGAAAALVAEGGEASAFSDFDLLELDRYSELNLIIRSLSETAVDVSTISRQLSNIHGGFDAYLNRLRMLLSELNEKTMRMRMTPMSTMISRLRRTVRETAAKLNKKVRLAIQGDHIELDKRVWEKLADPFMHLLRNAIDHGIEAPDVRKAAGKPEIATVRIAAAYQGNQVVIRVTDDGAGLDFDVIGKAFAVTRPETDAPDRQTLANLIFQPGFSTCQSISEVSGRGVGLDVVKDNILGLNGTVCVERSEKDIGTTFRISLPLTMAVMKALLFEVCGRRYAMGLYDIKEMLRLDPDKITGNQNKTVDIGGRRLPYYHLAQYLAEVVHDPSPGSVDRRPLALLVETESWQGAVAIDRMFGQRQIVIKSLGTHLRYVKGVDGATVMGDGQVVPILNIGELLKSGPAEQPHAVRSEQVKHAQQQPLEILVVDDSVSVRTVVARLMQRQGWKVRTAKDGVEAIERVHTRKPDLIILDVEMPRMNGYELMSSLRAQDAFKETPVIMLTSRATAKHRKKAKALGVNGFMTKPYRDEEFIALVRRLSQN
ncbi:MAG: response regulator [Desulfobacteraceae bacterium]|jgi:chemosensory pili system protein ChpA (sensor histidine kinase/response regulator)